MAMETDNPVHWKNHNKGFGLMLRDIKNHEEKLAKKVKYPMQGTCTYLVKGFLLEIDENAKARLSERLVSFMSIDPCGYWVYYLFKELSMKNKQATIDLLYELKNYNGTLEETSLKQVSDWFDLEDRTDSAEKRVLTLLKQHAVNICETYELHKRISRQ